MPAFASWEWDAAGALTGDNRLKAEGEAKQLQANMIDAAGRLKDKAQQAASTVSDALDSLTGKET